MHYLVGDNLFFWNSNSHGLDQALKSNLDGKLKKINSEEEDYILNVNENQYIEHLVDLCKVEELVLFEEKIYTTTSKSQIEVSRNPRYTSWPGSECWIDATDYSFHVPYSGERDLVKYTPGSFSMNPPRGIITTNEVVFTYRLSDDSHENIGTVQTEFESELNKFKGLMHSANSMVNSYNERLRSAVEQAFQLRKAKILEKQKSLASVLKYPIAGSQTKITYSVPATTIDTSVHRPPVVTKPSIPEPSLDIERYTHVLDTMFRLGCEMEKKPSMYRKFDEEELRDNFLTHLNLHYSATGETYNHKGKTDILIQESGKNIFIGECKFWGGQKVLFETIDQILSYQSWRDTKCAIIFFNKKIKDLGLVFKQVPEMLKGHPNFIEAVNFQHVSGYQFKMRHQIDSTKELILTIQAFNFYLSK